MAIRIKSADKVTAKYVANAGRAGGDYKEGIENPKRDWMESTVAAESSYEQGVQESITAKRFVKGVAAAGSAKQKAKSVTVGANRYGPGVQAAASDYQKGVTPVLQTIGSTELPPRFPKGDPRNLDRVRVLNENLRKMATA